jgi:hypothetical protein
VPPPSVGRLAGSLRRETVGTVSYDSSQRGDVVRRGFSLNNIDVVVIVKKHSLSTVQKYRQELLLSTLKMDGTVYFWAHFCPVAFFSQMIAMINITLKKTHF